MGYTLAEKILLAHTDVDDLAPGDVVMVACGVVMGPAQPSGGSCRARRR